MFCAVRYHISICFSLLFSNYSTYFLILFYVYFLYFCFIFCVFCVFVLLCIVLFIVSPCALSLSYFVQVYRPLPPAGTQLQQINIIYLIYHGMHEMCKLSHYAHEKSNAVSCVCETSVHQQYKIQWFVR